MRSASAAAPSTATPSMPVATFSIVARDPATGELGVAVQSHWFSVGSVVPWAEAGVGRGGDAVVRRAVLRTRRGSPSMKRGSPRRTRWRSSSPPTGSAQVRQVAFVDAKGRVAVHTGAKCIPGAGHHVGNGYTTEANLMLTNEVPDAMAQAFEAAKGPLAERMLAALDAAQGVGGDVRGKQSAAILVVRAKPTDKPWTDRIVDLRIEDHAEPLKEMRRLLTLHRAYEMMNRGDEAVGAREDGRGAQGVRRRRGDGPRQRRVRLLDRRRAGLERPHRRCASAVREGVSDEPVVDAPRCRACRRSASFPTRRVSSPRILAVGPKADLAAK